MADDLGGDALAHLALGLGIDRQREVGMGLDVDEAGRDGEAGGVDGLLRRAADVATMRRAIAAAAVPLPSNSVPPRIRMSYTRSPLPPRLMPS